MSSKTQEGEKAKAKEQKLRGIAFSGCRTPKDGQRSAGMSDYSRTPETPFSATLAGAPVHVCVYKEYICMCMYSYTHPECVYGYVAVIV